MKQAVISIQMLAWALRALFLVGVLVTLLFFIDAHLKAKITIFDAEASTLITRILYHPSIMLYDLPMQRLTSGVIDVDSCEKLSDEAFDKSIHYGKAKKHIAGKFSVTDGTRVVCEATFNKKLYGFLFVQTQAGGVFRLGVDKKYEKLPVILKQDNTLKSGFIEINILKET